MSAGEESFGAADLAEAQLGDLLKELLSRVQGVLDERARWELLLEAVVAMSAELSQETLLSRIVTIARRLAGARYAALGVLDGGTERPLRTFVFDGLDQETAERIGELPTGHGLLGLLIEHPEPLRLRDMAAHSASYGFPERHPPMHSFLGVPLRTGDRVFGNLYLTEKEGGEEFTEQDERIMVALAAAAGIAIENTILQEEAARRERWLAASAEITALLVDATDYLEALQAVADRALELSGADAVWIVAGNGGLLQVQVVSGPRVDMNELHALSLEDSLAAQVIQSGKPLSIDDLSLDPRATAKETVRGWPHLGPALIVPLRASGGIEGALTLGWTPAHGGRFRELDAAMPAAFVEQAALALQIGRAHEDRERLVVFEDRDRIARDLHDLVIQRLFAIGLGLRSASRLANDNEVADRVDSAVDDIDATIRDIRRSIFELGSGIGTGDVQSEITELVTRATAALKFRPLLRFEGPVRTLIPTAVVPDLLAVLREVLSNAARHAQASSLHITVSVGDEVSLVVIDDGLGIPPDAVESGLSNIRQRAVRHGGTCTISRPDDRAGGTRVAWTVPLAG